VTSRGETITMLDDEGLPHDFTLIDVVVVDDRRYAVLQPEDQDTGAVLFRLDGDRMAPIDDDAEFDQVVDALRSLGEYDDLIIEDPGPERPQDDDDHDGRDEEDDEEDDGEDDEDVPDEDEDDGEEDDDDEDDDDEEDDDW